MIDAALNYMFTDLFVGLLLILSSSCVNQFHLLLVAAVYIQLPMLIVKSPLLQEVKFSI